ncbi:hypothetical protein NDU88_004984 [Pleurodeles waltl]|uniref:Uncharacterized protein n=1 Tax=Pleurodeles waltl TaxID=8319 RepID=A0AAV7RKW8_PLEWA|nr:hypothetical protein NDU88_004984 [Pleurodeles waltl]
MTCRREVGSAPHLRPLQVQHRPQERTPTPISGHSVRAGPLVLSFDGLLGPRLWVPPSTELDPSVVSVARLARAFTLALPALGQVQPVVRFFGVSDRMKFARLLPSTTQTCQGRFRVSMG